MTILELIKPSIASHSSVPFKGRVEFYENQSTYRNTSVFRGFPMGSIGTGGFGIDTTGGFVDLRINNNWMNPVKLAKGSFWAISCLQNNRRSSRILRKSLPSGKDYQNIQPIKDVLFWGNFPFFKQEFLDEFPVHVLVEGFSPLISHNIKDSSLPAAVFYVDLQNLSNAPVETSFLFSWENILGCGGTGNTGMRLRAGRLAGAKGRLTYDDRRRNAQEWIQTGNLHGLNFYTNQQWQEQSHRCGVLGRYLLLVENQPDLTISTASQWNATETRPRLIEQFTRSGNISFARSASKKKAYRHPAGAICINTFLRQRETRRITFFLIWWTPNHVTEKDVVKKARSRKHQGVRVGHYYENHFNTPEALAGYLEKEHRRLYDETYELHKLLEKTTLPNWIRRSLINSASAMICNTVLPKNGYLYTIKGMDWEWLFGGLTGAIDQRLSSLPYSSTFFTELDRREVDLIRRLNRAGIVPYGSGNCDLALDTAEVPYGWPMRIPRIPKAEQRPDLILSCILQIYRLYRITGNQDWLTECWPDLLKMLAVLGKWSKAGLPEGGSTFNAFSFRGAFIYTAGLYLAALNALIELAKVLDSSKVEEIQQLRKSALERIDAVLWNSTAGYYRSTEKRNTAFISALAGDWFARYAGLQPVFPLERVRSHLDFVYRSLLHDRDGVSGDSAYPYAETAPNGKPVENRLIGIHRMSAYAWLVISYFGLEAIYADKMAEGLKTIQILFDRIWQSGWPWSADQFGNAGAAMMTSPVIWALPAALSGAVLDRPRETLAFSPRRFPETDHQITPLFFPSFWGLLELDWLSRKGLCTITHKFEKPIKIKRLIISNTNDNLVVQKLTPAVKLEPGCQIEFEIPVEC